MKKKDILIIVLALAAALLLYGISQISGGASAATVVVTVDGQEVLRRPMAVEDSYEIRQEDGSVNIIAVEDGAVYMKEANCRDGLCIRQGKEKPLRQSFACPISWWSALRATSLRTRAAISTSSSNEEHAYEPNQSLACRCEEHPGCAPCGHV